MPDNLRDDTHFQEPTRHSAPMKMHAIALLLGVLSLGTGCATTAPWLGDPPPPLQRAIVEPADIASAQAIEARIKALSQTLPAPGEPWFEFVRGSQRVIVSAPHATRPLREGKYRFSDGPGTAALAQSLHAICGATVINTTRNSPSDPNYYDDNDYKRELARLIAELHPMLVLDIHGSHPSRPYEVDFGTMHGDSLLGQEALVTDLAVHLRAEGLLNLSDNRFAASGKETVTKFASRLGVPAIQLEISTTRLQTGQGCPANAPLTCGSLESHRFAQLLQGLIRYLESMGQCTRAPPENSGAPTGPAPTPTAAG